MAIVPGNTSALATNNSFGSKSLSHNSNGDFIVLSIVSGASTGTPSSVKYGTDNMTLATSKTSGNGKVWIYYLYSPSSGSNNFTYTISIGDSNAAFGLSLTGVIESSPVGQTGSDSSSPVSTTLTSLESDSIVIDCFQGVKTSPSTPVPGAGQTVIGRSFGNTFYMHGSSYKLHGSASTTMSWSGTFNYWAAQAVTEIKAKYNPEKANVIFMFS